MTRSTFKTSTIFVAIGEETNIYKSLHEMPPRVRRKLRESSRAWNSATIMIADRKGRDELVRAMQGQPSQVDSRLVRSGAARRLITPGMPENSSGPVASQKPVAPPWRHWAEIGVLGAIGLALWLLFFGR